MIVVLFVARQDWARGAAEPRRKKIHRKGHEDHKECAKEESRAKRAMSFVTFVLFVVNLSPSPRLRVGYFLDA
jgi:hypothetical protein